MKNLRNFALAAFALLGFAACQQEEFAPEIKNPTHSVTFVAGAPETKTTVDVSDGETAQSAWTTDDKNRISVYENGEAATKNPEMPSIAAIYFTISDATAFALLSSLAFTISSSIVHPPSAAFF